MVIDQREKSVIKQLSENWDRFGGAPKQWEDRSRLPDQPQKRNGSALSQSTGKWESPWTEERSAWRTAQDEAGRQGHTQVESKSRTYTYILT